jgi:hypothetical protein
MRINPSSVREQAPVQKPKPQAPKQAVKEDRPQPEVKSPPPAKNRIDIKA